MYKTATFINHFQFLELKLQAYVINSSCNAWINIFQQDKPLESLDILPKHFNFKYSDIWYIHGGFLDHSRYSSSNLILYDGPNFSENFENIDNQFMWFSENFLWSIFPWGGPRNFLSFCFLSKDKKIFNEFLNCNSFIMDQVNECNIDFISSQTISSYEIETRFSRSIQAIIFSGYHEPAFRLWDVCNCDVNHPWFITDFLIDEDTFPILSLPIPEYKILFSIDRDNDTPLKVYQPLNKESFESLCKLTSQEPDTMIFVSPDTDVVKLKDLLMNIENEQSYSDLNRIQDILNTTNWFYGLNRDRVDYGISLFVSRENNLLHSFDQINRNDGYCLLSCF